jgi:hypothetical protein
VAIRCHLQTPLLFRLFAAIAEVPLSLTSPPSSQADGIVCVKTTQAVLVAEYVSPTTPGEATKIVEGESWLFLCLLRFGADLSAPHRARRLPSRGRILEDG